MNTTADQPAFPGIAGETGYGNATISISADGTIKFTEHNQGITKREYFAAMAMQGLLASDMPARLADADVSGLEASMLLAGSSVQIADALLAALSSSPTSGAEGKE